MYLQSLVLQDVSSRPSQIDPRPQEICKYSNLLKLFFKTKIAIDFCYLRFFFQIMMTCVVFTFHDLRANGGEIPCMHHVTGL